MKKYLVGHKESRFGEKGFCIVEAGDEREAVFQFGLHVGRHDECFLEEIICQDWGECFEEQFWDISGPMFRGLNPSAQQEAIKRFEDCVCKSFADRPEWANLYLVRCKEAREHGDWRIRADFPPEMLAAMWAIQYGDACIAFELTEILVSEKV